ncbi:MAG TPA: response regulator [Acidimicrobiales bacterium]|nr:response regulator [Acidimicrobiales bacterium]
MARGRGKVKSQVEATSPRDGASLNGQDAHDAVRSSQRIASQLHQLIAASITVAGMRNEHDILKSLASSTRRVFDADVAVLTLESGAEAPLRGVAHRGRPVACLGPDEFAAMDDVPASRSTFVPWNDRDWLVAPVLERRDQARGVLAVRRAEGEFLAEDREVLTLMAQMAATALGATELSREIETSETRLRILVDTAPAGIVEVDLKGHVRWWNRAASKILAWPTYDEATVTEPHFPSGARNELAALWLEVLDGAVASGRDLIDVEIKGRRRYLTTSAALLPSPEGQATSILMLVDDVTDHRELKAEIHHAQQMEIRGRVASSVAHDFNNLLTLISGYAEILAKDLSDDVHKLEMVKDIQSTASRASMLTAQLQSIGRTQSLEPVVLDPVAALQSNAEVFDRIVGGDIESHWSLSANAGAIRVDAGQFEQMMLNLAINARDAMPSGGELRVSVDAVVLDVAQASQLNLAPGDYVAIVVADSGVGMDEETRQHCFDTFFTTKGPFKGTGLGLAAARRLVEGSGGAITCASALGVGTTFKIFFPASHDAIIEEPVTPRFERPRGSATVLVADDDEDLRRLMVQVLSRNGYEVLVADSGEEALIVARGFDGAIDLLVSDVEMSELTGPELAASLQRANPSLRILLTSGTAEASVVRDLLPGTSEFLPKPFRPSALIDRVHDLLSRR